MDVLDADSGDTTARPDRTGYAIRLRRSGRIPPEVHIAHHD